MNDPVSLNCYKHHLGFICSKIKRIKKIDELYCFVKGLKILGNSLTDVYTGTIETENIIAKINYLLLKEGHFEKKEYEKWIKRNKNFRVITIEDGSSWVLIYNNNSDRYIHLHPARYSMKTLRINASTYKTAIVTVTYCKISKISFLNVELINKLRCEFLELSAVKSMDSICSIKKLIRLINENMQTI